MANRNSTITAATGVPGAKTPAQTFLASNYAPDVTEGLGQVVTVHFAIDGTNDSIINYTVDGTKYHSFLNGIALKANSAIERQITLRQGDQLNFKSAVNIGLDYLYLDLV